MTLKYGMSSRRKERYLQEQQRLTKFAPRISCKGPHIRDFEELSRVAFYPDHTHDDGSLKVEGISRQDLTNRGFSVFRRTYTTRNIIDNFIALQIERHPDRHLEYVLSFLAGAVRAVNDSEDYQAFVIIDSANTEDLKGHALILCAESHNKSKVKELRHALHNIINNPIKLDHLYPS